jgi:hypothetical protein
MVNREQKTEFDLLRVSLNKNKNHECLFTVFNLIIKKIKLSCLNP